MKTVSPALAAKLADRALQLAMLLTITRRDGAVVRLTDYDRAITLSGQTWLPQAGLKRTAISVTAGLEVDSLDIEGYFDGPLDEDSLRKGRFDGAALEIALCEASDPGLYGSLTVFYGTIGNITLHRHRFRFAVAGLLELLQQSFGEVTSPDCRANLGDARCGVNLSPWTFTGTVTTVISPLDYSVSVSQPAGQFDYGLCRFTGGANAGVEIEVKSSTTTGITLFLPPPYAAVAGDAITLIAGCDKRFETCVAKFGNAARFRGEPHLPGRAPLAENASTLL